jgi:hypothetical protein
LLETRLAKVEQLGNLSASIHLDPYSIPGWHLDFFTTVALPQFGHSFDSLVGWREVDVELLARLEFSAQVGIANL